MAINNIYYSKRNLKKGSLYILNLPKGVWLYSYKYSDWDSVIFFQRINHLEKSTPIFVSHNYIILFLEQGNLDPNKYRVMFNDTIGIIIHYGILSPFDEIK